MSDERKLATVVVIESLTPIDGADAIELAHMRNKGWQVVVKKGEFRVGQKAIYMEIDSFLPIRPEFEFLRKSCLRTMNGTEGFRIKTVRLRKQLSQGILFPCSVLSNCTEHALVEGDDLTELLGITKYELPIPAQLAGRVRGNFPTHILRKSDEERIQNVWYKERDTILSNEFYVTVKLDGSSFSCYLAPDSKQEGEPLTFGVCSRNMDLYETEGNAYWAAARRLQLEEKLRDYYNNSNDLNSIALQGELYGRGIQGNPEQLDNVDVYFFGAFVNGERLKFSEFTALIRHLGLKTVPIINDCFHFHPANTLEEILASADGPGYFNPKAKREGIVFRALNNSISFKAISNQYLLSERE